MEVGRRIKFFRERKGITVNRLANLSGVSQSYLRDIELGNKQPTVEYLEYICNGLGITLQTFFSEPGSDERLADLIGRLSPEQKRLLIAFLETLRL